MHTIVFGLLIKFLVKSYLCTSMLHSNLEQEFTADFGKLVFKHFFLSLYISVATPHTLILGATGVIAELVGSYQYLQIQQYLQCLMLKVCMMSHFLLLTLFQSTTPYAMVLEIIACSLPKNIIYFLFSKPVHFFINIHGHLGNG